MRGPVLPDRFLPRFPAVPRSIWCGCGAGALRAEVGHGLDDVCPDKIAPGVPRYAEACRDDVVKEVRLGDLDRVVRPPQRIALGAQQEARPIGLEAVLVDPVLRATRAHAFGCHGQHGTPRESARFPTVVVPRGSRTGSFTCVHRRSVAE